jgi:leader peptidase (prepilin peptidase) / N-methyltransferase
MTDSETGEHVYPVDELRPNSAILIGAGTAIGLVSALSLPAPIAVASTVLGTLMVAGADIDARTCLLPNAVTLGAAVCGVVAAPLLDGLSPWLAMADAVLRAMGAAGLLALLRWGYGRIRHREGLGLGDVKLAAAVGAWLPIEFWPLCFSLASGGALVTVLWARWRGDRVDGAMRIPLGAFLCPALWLTFYADNLPTAW